jgi:uncharacterized protein YbjT (DUF2867 family)
MKVFVTGGSGYVGRETIRALRRRGHDVTALVRGDHAAEVVAGLGATPVTGTLRDLAVLSTAAADADGAIHLAVERGPRAAESTRELRRPFRMASARAPTCIPAACGCTATRTGS